MLVPYLDEYHRLEEMLGDDGVIVTGLRCSPMQQIMRDWMGYERFFYELHDHQTKVERLYELTAELSRKVLNILVNSPVKIVKVCTNRVSAVHTPIFKKYFVP
jgi:hypothetical protein